MMDTKSNSSSSNAMVLQLPPPRIPVPIILEDFNIALNVVGEELTRVSELILDCESENGHLSLVQIGTRRKFYFFDLLKCPKLSFAFKGILESPYIVKIMHSGGKNQRLLLNDFGIVLQNVFDTQLYYKTDFIGDGQKVKKLSIPELWTSLDYRQDERLEHLFVQRYKKNFPGFWRRRPFDLEMIDFGTLDLLYLWPIYDRLLQGKGNYEIDEHVQIFDAGPAQVQTPHTAMNFTSPAQNNGDGNDNDGDDAEGFEEEFSSFDDEAPVDGVGGSGSKKPRYDDNKMKKKIKRKVIVIKDGKHAKQELGIFKKKIRKDDLQILWECSHDGNAQILFLGLTSTKTVLIFDLTGPTYIQLYLNEIFSDFNYRKVLFRPDFASVKKFKFIFNNALVILNMVKEVYPNINYEFIKDMELLGLCKYFNLPIGNKKDSVPTPNSFELRPIRKHMLVYSCLQISAFKSLFDRLMSKKSEWPLQSYDTTTTNKFSNDVHVQIKQDQGSRRNEDKSTIPQSTSKTQFHNVKTEQLQAQKVSFIHGQGQEGNEKSKLPTRTANPSISNIHFESSSFIKRKPQMYSEGGPIKSNSTNQSQSSAGTSHGGFQNSTSKQYQIEQDILSNLKSKVSLPPMNSSNDPRFQNLNPKQQEQLEQEMIMNLQSKSNKSLINPSSAASASDSQQVQFKSFNLISRQPRKPIEPVAETQKMSIPPPINPINTSNAQHQSFNFYVNQEQQQFYPTDNSTRQFQFQSQNQQPGNSSGNQFQNFHQTQQQQQQLEQERLLKSMTLPPPPNISNNQFHFQNFNFYAKQLQAEAELKKSNMSAMPPINTANVKLQNFDQSQQQFQPQIQTPYNAMQSSMFPVPSINTSNIQYQNFNFSQGQQQYQSLNTGMAGSNQFQNYFPGQGHELKPPGVEVEEIVIKDDDDNDKDSSDEDNDVIPFSVQPKQFTLVFSKLPITLKKKRAIHYRKGINSVKDQTVISVDTKGYSVKLPQQHKDDAIETEYKITLIIIGTLNKIIVFDMISQKFFDIIKVLLENPNVLKVMNKSTIQGITLRKHGISVKNVFDTDGYKSATNSVFYANFMQKLNKYEEIDTKSNYRKRPLPPKALENATNTASALIQNYQFLKNIIDNS